MKFRKAIIIALATAALFTFAGCSAGKAALTPAVSQDTIFALYNKVELNQSKDKIDSVLAIAPVPATDMEIPNGNKIYKYCDSKTDFGVSVLYDKNNKSVTKTVIYESHSCIAPFCKKAVTKEQSNQIKRDMTYDQVKTLLGGEGIEVCRTLSDGEQSVDRRWANSDGSCIQIGFKANDTVSNSVYYANNY